MEDADNKAKARLNAQHELNCAVASFVCAEIGGESGLGNRGSAAIDIENAAKHRQPAHRAILWNLNLAGGMNQSKHLSGVVRNMLVSIPGVSSSAGARFVVSRALTAVAVVAAADGTEESNEAAVCCASSTIVAWSAVAGLQSANSFVGFTTVGSVSARRARLCARHIRSTNARRCCSRSCHRCAKLADREHW